MELPICLTVQAWAAKSVQFTSATDSLGGNLVETYIEQVLASYGHPARSKNAFVITLATPVLGSQVADLADALKTNLHMDDDLLKSLEKNNLFLRMLLNFRAREDAKAGLGGCRQVNLHAAYEKKEMGPFLIVDQSSGVLPIVNSVASPIVGFDLDHSEMAKPSGPTDTVYKWVMDRLNLEYDRLDNWDAVTENAAPEFKLCAKIPVLPEPP